MLRIAGLDILLAVWTTGAIVTSVTVMQVPRFSGLPLLGSGLVRWCSSFGPSSLQPALPASDGKPKTRRSTTSRSARQRLWADFTRCFPRRPRDRTT